jgi:aspartyl-tRNA(Asn)/glutamyl-tRNA(Gln) amidotransferase subunit C
MKISREQVAHIAELSRLELDQETLDLYQGQLDAILDYMETLGELDTQGVEPLYSPVEKHTVLRSDEVKNEFTRAQILGNAPDTDGEYFLVPKVL